MPSLWEGLSISLLEAMVAGKPVVTTSIGGNREAAANGKAAALVAPKDAEGLGAAICRLAHDPAERSRLAAAGQAEHRSRFTMDRMLDAYMAEYERLSTQTQEHPQPVPRPRGSTVS
jgi:glycosyltransferase involved in cell wall biosynthesis